MQDFDYATRNSALLGKLDGKICLVTSPASIRWLTGFAGSTANVVATLGELVLLVDSRYTTYAQSLPAVTSGLVEAKEITAATLPDLVSGLVGDAKLHVSSKDLTLAYADRLAGAGLDVISGSDPVLALRLVKDNLELGLATKAIEIAEAAFARTLASLEPGMTESDFALQLDVAMMEAGSQGVGFETICATANNSVQPHAVPTDKKITEGELTIVDWGANVDGYKSDSSRTIWLGEIDKPQQDLFNAVKAAIEAATAAITPGATYGDVKAAADNVLTEAGYGDNILHPFGHNVGLDIHELPYFSAGQSDVLELGHLVALEPAAYVPGVGGVRLENLITVTTNGCRVLNELPLDVRSI